MTDTHALERTFSVSVKLSVSGSSYFNFFFFQLNIPWQFLHSNTQCAPPCVCLCCSVFSSVLRTITFEGVIYNIFLFSFRILLSDYVTCLNRGEREFAGQMSTEAPPCFRLTSVFFFGISITAPTSIAIFAPASRLDFEFRIHLDCGYQGRRSLDFFV